MNTLSGKYFIRRSSSDEWEDMTSKFRGLRVLSVDGMNERGEAVNVYTEQWIDSQTEDFLVTTIDEGGNPVIIRKNVDIRITFIVGERYGASDTITDHEAFVDWICNHNDFYIKSLYSGKQAHVVCIKEYKPTTEKLHRGANSYIIGTLELHTLDAPSVAE